MKILKKKIFVGFCGFGLVVLVFLALFFCVKFEPHVVYALSPDDVLATYTFTPINDTDCDVCIANKESATRAIIPRETEIDGKIYRVTEIALNGFMSSTKLKRVTLSPTVEKIGNTAFANCTALEEMYLANVKVIGNNSFMRCTALSEITIPKSITSMGVTVFRNCNTFVRVRAEENETSSWSSTWNSYNGNLNVEYGSKHEDPPVYNPIYATTRGYLNNTSTNIVGYALAGGQPYVEDFYKNSVIVIPATHPNGLPNLLIETYSYSYTTFTQLIIEYSDQPISIETGAFWGCEGNNITINRQVNYIDATTNNQLAENIFTEAKVKTIILPNNLPGICKAMFYECQQLENIYFITPTERQDPEKIVEEQETKATEQNTKGTVSLPTLSTFTYIGETAFYNTKQLSTLKIPSNVKTVEKEVVKGWTNEQVVDIDFVYEQYPQWNEDTQSGWKSTFKSNSFAKILYSKYRISFDPCGGVLPQNKNYIDVQRDEPIGTLPIPTKPSAVFDGWFTEKNGSGEQYLPTTKLKSYENRTLYAKWCLTATFNPVGGSTVRSVTGLEGDIIKLPTSFLGGHSGYWRNNSNGKTYDFGANYTFSSNSVSFTAVWNELPLNNCYNSNTFRYEIWTNNQLIELMSFNTTSRTFELMNDCEVGGAWGGIPEFNGTLIGNNHTITYQNLSVPYGKNYGFINSNKGQVLSVRFKPTINVLDKPSNVEVIFTGVGGAVGINYGTLNGVYIEKTVQNPYMYSSGTCSVDLYAHNVFTVDLGGVCGNNYGVIENCYNYASLGGGSPMGGIAAASYQNTTIKNCTNSGNIYYNFSNNSTVCIGGIVGSAWENSYLESCTNWATITWAASLYYDRNIQPMIARLAGQVNVTVSDVNNNAYGQVIVSETVRTNVDSVQLLKVKDEKYADVYDPNGGGSGGCVASGTLITLADGRQVPVESLTGDEMLLVWNLHTGTFDIAPILFIDSDPTQQYEVINVYFSDGTSVKVITEHGFWDATLNQYVYLDENASQYIGHWFNKQTVGTNGQLTWTTVQLVKVDVCEEYTTAWSPVTYSHLCYYVNGMLSMPGGINGLFNIFEVDAETMQYDVAAMERDIAKYGLFTYEEFAQKLPVSQEVFDAFNAQYFKVAIGKGLVTEERLAQLVERYAEQLGIN